MFVSVADLYRSLEHDFVWTRMQVTLDETGLFRSIACSLK